MSQNADSASRGDAGPNLSKRVEARFGVLPNFFRLASETPEITDKLWGFAQAAYLDSPFPSIFKERLFVYLSRFCAVRYCIARHVGFLVGLGRPAGDASVHTQSIVEVVRLLRRPFPRGEQLQAHLSFCSTRPAPLAEMPDAGSQMEEAIFALAGHVFVQTPDAPACLDALERLLGPARLQWFLLFLAFVRAAHYWTRVHPELALEDDVKQLLATHEALAECILNDSEAKTDSVSQSLLDELPALRLKADKAIGLLAAIVDNSDDAIVSKNLDGVITSWNKGAERLFGYTAQEATGQRITLIIPPDHRQEEVTILERLRRGERIQHFETVRMRKDGSRFDISLTISPVKDATGRIVGASKIARDITERKHAERVQAEQTRLLDLSSDAIIVRDATDRVRYWNKAASELYGYTRDEALGRVTHELLRTQFPEPLESIKEQLHRNDRWTGELIHRKNDGSPIAVLSRWVLDRDVDGKRWSILETNSDVTERKQAQEAIKEREFSARLLQSQDQERRRIARELHDGVGQLLAAVSMNTARIAAEKANLGSDAARSAEENLSLIMQISNDIRTVSYLLHPPLLEEMGLRAALEWYVEGFAERSKIAVIQDLQLGVERLPDDVELCLFRVAQECLTNIHRHSGSAKAEIRLVQENGNVHLEVRDEGKGIPPEKQQALNTYGTLGVGFGGMRERLRQLSGTLQVRSNGNGTTVIATIPLADPHSTREGI
jgi:PAS domain S-box-containing protein